MKKQYSLYENVIRPKPIEYKEVKRLCVSMDKSREFVTKKGFVIHVQRVEKRSIQGVGEVYGLYQVSDRGKVIFPLQSIGVKNYIKNN